MTPEHARIVALERRLAAAADTVVSAFAEQHTTILVGTMLLEPGALSLTVDCPCRWSPGWRQKRRSAMDAIAGRFGGLGVRNLGGGRLLMTVPFGSE